MNKKSALVTAGGLAASFVAGIAAVSFNWGMGTPAPAVTAAAAAPTAPKHVKPIVRHRRIVVHKKAPAPKGPASSSPGSRTVRVAPPTPTPPVVTTSGSHAGGGESDDRGEGGEGGDD
jgi:hypothetical protein